MHQPLSSLKAFEPKARATMTVSHMHAPARNAALSRACVAAAQKTLMRADFPRVVFRIPWNSDFVPVVLGSGLALKKGALGASRRELNGRGLLTQSFKYDVYIYESLNLRITVPCQVIHSLLRCSSPGKRAGWGWMGRLRQEDGSPLAQRKHGAYTRQQWTPPRILRNLNP